MRIKEEAGMREGGDVLFHGSAVLAWHRSTQKKTLSSVPSWLDALGKRWLVAVERVWGGRRRVACNLCRTLEERRGDHCKRNV